MPVSNPYNYLGGFNFQPVARPNAPTSNWAGSVANGINDISSIMNSFYERQQKEALNALQKQKLETEIAAQQSAADVNNANIKAKAAYQAQLNTFPTSREETYEMAPAVSQPVSGPTLPGEPSVLPPKVTPAQMGTRTVHPSMAEQQQWIANHPGMANDENIKARMNPDVDPQVNKDFGVVSEWSKNNPKAGANEIFEYAISVNPALANHSGFKNTLDAAQKAESQAGSDAGRNEAARHNRFQEGIDVERLGIERAAKAAAASKEKEPNDEQKKAAGYALRMQDSNNIIVGLKNKGYDRTSLGTAVWNTITPNMLNTNEYQLESQAEGDFLRAVLRRESGASISDTETKNGVEQYFPRQGDTEETVKQKENNRINSLAAIKSSAGETAWTRAVNEAARMKEISNPTPKGPEELSVKNPPMAPGTPLFGGQAPPQPQPGSTQVGRFQVRAR